MTKKICAKCGYYDEGTEECGYWGTHLEDIEICDQFDRE